MISQRIRVQNALWALAVDGEFPSVSYVLSEACVNSQDLQIPSSAVTNEVASRFQAGHNKRELVLDRQNWIFQLRIEFTKEVLFEFFERARCTPTILAADPASGLRQVTLILLEATYEHPPQVAPTSGSKARYLFEARESPV